MQFTKKVMLAKDDPSSIDPARGRVSKKELERKAAEIEQERSSKKKRLLQDMAMEVAADDDQPFPAPYPKKKDWWARKQK